MSDMGSRQRAVMERLLEVFGLEQLEQFADVLVQTHDLAVLRGVRQEMTVVFNEKGLPRQFNATNNFAPVKPKLYHAE